VNPDSKYDQSFQAILNSPRTIEACRRQGVNLADLDPVTEDKVKKILSERKDKASKRAIPRVLIDIRLKHYEERRRELFRLIREVMGLEDLIVDYRNDI
jgi:hypothetical protein